METRTETRKRKKQDGGEGLFCILMLLFAVFELILLITVAARAFAPDDALQPPDTEESSESDTLDGSESGEDQPATPVFSGGVIPARPTNGSSAAIISGIGSQYALLVNAETGEIVAQKNADTSFSPASMTKVMTLIVACEKLTSADLDRKLTMTQEIYDYARAGAYADSTLYGIDVGDEYSIRDLLYGIGMESASDCVLPVVFDLCESETEFVAWMNSKAEALGLTQTSFDNAIGHDSTGNHTTAEDMAVIMSYAMQSELISDILGKEVYRSTAAGYNSQGVYLPSFPFTFYSSLFGDHDGSRMAAYKRQYGKDFSLESATLLAGKTGWTSGNFCLVSYVRDKSGAEYVLVLAKASTSYGTMADVKAVLDTYLK